jgi:hypothetical protein
VAGDDAERYRLVALTDIPEDGLVFDHAQILRDFRAWFRRGAPAPV